MARFRLEAGAQYELKGRVHRLITHVVIGNVSSWLVMSLTDGATVTESAVTLEQLYATGDLVRHDDGGRSGIRGPAAGPRKRPEGSSLSEADTVRRSTRKKFLQSVELHSGGNCSGSSFAGRRPPASTLVLKAALEACWQPAGLAKKPSLATYYRWRHRCDPEDSIGLVGNFADRGNRQQVEPIIREGIMSAYRRMLDNALGERAAGRLTLITGRDLVRVAAEAVAVLGRLHSRADLRIPCKATLYEWWKEFPAFERDTLKHGPVKARMLYRTIVGHNRPKIALDECEYDETLLPFFFYDDERRIPLGRATLCWFLDVATHSVVGFYIGFEPPGDLTMMSAMRHACTPKAYTRDEYPDLKSAYGQHGIPRSIRIDNSKQAWGKTAEQICSALDIDWDWCPSRTPYFKPVVEGMFKMLNDQLLQQLPGFVLPRDGAYGDAYDPAKNAVIEFRLFLKIFHVWLIDVYHTARQPRLGGSPNERWAEGVAVIPVGLVDRASDLRSLFGIERDARLDHKGVVYEGLYFRSEALQQIRLDFGHTQKVRVKIDPSNLRSVHVRHPRTGAWIEADAERKAYAAGLALVQHQRIREYERQKFGTDGERALEAQKALAAVIEDVAGGAQSIRRNTLAARFLGVGTNNIFGSLDHDGQLGLLTGPFTGQRLNPTADTVLVTPAASAQRGTSSKSLEPPAVIIAPQQAVQMGTPSNDENPAPEPPVPLPSRPARRTFVADRSLSRKKTS